MPDHKIPLITDFNILVVGSQRALGSKAEKREEIVDLSSEEAAKAQRFGLTYSTFKEEGKSDPIVCAKISRFVHESLGQALKRFI